MIAFLPHCPHAMGEQVNGDRKIVTERCCFCGQEQDRHFYLHHNNIDGHGNHVSEPKWYPNHPEGLEAHPCLKRREEVAPAKEEGNF